MPIDGKLVAITGAARGIGSATAALLARGGALVALGDLDGELAAREAERIGAGARGYELDVTSSSSFASFIDRAETDFGRPLDVLVNNAGILWAGSFADEPEALSRRQMDVNFHGPARGMALVIPAMRARGHGQVVNIASAASRLPAAGEASYAASKHALYGYSLSVREELRGSGVEISLVFPSVVDTQLSRGTAHGRTRRLDPADVAQAVLGVIERPRAHVYIPRVVGPWATFLSVLPQCARDVLSARLMPNQLDEMDRSARAAYQRQLED